MAKTGSTMSQKPKKIVSTREYTKTTGKRLMLITISIALFFFALEDRNGYFALSYLLGRDPGYSYSTIIFLCNVLISFGVAWAGIRTFKKARQIDPVLPRTRANIAHLPAAESLVRASEQPILSQQSVLLRPATDAQDRHEEQLLKPS